MNAEQMIAQAEAYSVLYSEDGLFTERSETHGAYREVFIIGDYAFKCEGRANLKMNQSEWDLYCLVPDDVKQWLAKPVYISRNGNVIVMEKLSTGPYLSHLDSRDSLIQSLREIAGHLRIVDLHRGNFGVTKTGKVVCLDYAGVLYAVQSFYGSYKSSDYDRNRMQEWLTAKIPA